MPVKHSWMADLFKLPGWAQNEVEEKLCQWVEKETGKGLLAQWALRTAGYFLERPGLKQLAKTDSVLARALSEVGTPDDAVELMNQDYNWLMTPADKASMKDVLERLISGELKPDQLTLTPSEES